MKFLHLADLHIGKKLYEYPLYEDQRFVLKQAVNLAEEQSVDAIVIAGDVYDSSAPSAEAMECYDWLLNELFALKKPLLIISGNHDSAERLNVASSILRHSGVYIVTKLEDAVKPIPIAGVDFYLMPYFRPSDANRLLGSDCKTYQAAMAAVLEQMSINRAHPNVLVAHQAILPSGKKIEASGSETSLDVDTHHLVGGTEVIDTSLFNAFDYLALGHIHKGQFVSDNARYPGAILKYHVDEAQAQRTFTIVEMNGKTAKVTEYPIHPLHDLAVLEGSLDELLHREGHENDYVYCRLTDEISVDSPMAKLKAKYPLCLALEYIRIRPLVSEAADFEDVEEISRDELFGTFFKKYAGRELNERERALVHNLFDKKEAEA